MRCGTHVSFPILYARREAIFQSKVTGKMSDFHQPSLHYTSCEYGLCWPTSSRGRKQNKQAGARPAGESETGPPHSRGAHVQRPPPRALECHRPWCARWRSPTPRSNALNDHYMARTRGNALNREFTEEGRSTSAQEITATK